MKTVLPMRITLCGSARFEAEFKRLNTVLSLAGYVVYSLAVYPSDAGGKDWYTPEQKEMLDAVHRAKIVNSDAVYVIAPDGYVGKSTRGEIAFARHLDKLVMCSYPGVGDVQTCEHEICSNPTRVPPCTQCAHLSRRSR